MLLLIVFGSCFTAYSQPIEISVDQARHALLTHDSLQECKSELSFRKSKEAILKEKIRAYLEQLQNMQSQLANAEKKSDIKDQQAALLREDIKVLKKQVNKLKFHRLLLGVATVAVLIAGVVLSSR